ncbi:hypothetical protein NM688_g7981 [Phlebia brevispora]|uniref:Uncharacterized protein n=1 Tax=Phlebia brevispora TaxID=194682 RepID=A0ACC1RZ08_9APHY|nr:hypothetical protein NM688_g7981 [Phlebia brevispora]
MFSKALLVAFLSLSLTASTFAAPAQDFGFHPPSNNNKGNQNNQEECSAVKTVTVTAAAAASTAASGSSGKGGNNAAGNGAAGNNKAGTTSAAAASATAATLAVASSAASSVASSAASTATSAASSGGDIQSSLTLDPSVIAQGFENNGQAVQEAGQVASLTSSNNFINFCATVPNLPITNGQQITTGSCNPAPMGIIAATTNMPSSKFVFPPNFGTVKANTEFTVQMAINNLETGFFVNANQNFFAAPQQVNTAGNIQGHSHVVIEQIDSLTSTNPTDPTKFAFFKGLNAVASNGILTADVTAGLPAGTYRLASINTAANHQPVLVAIAQHGALDDMIYFTVTDDGQPAAGSNSTAAASSNAASSASSSAAAATSSAASVGGLKGGKKSRK